MNNLLLSSMRDLRSQLRKKWSLYLFFKQKQDNDRNLKSLQNCHKGRRCFIICNGPSLKPEDLTMIHKKGDISIASNKIDKIFSQTEWRPTYYVITDNGYQFSLLDTMKKIPAKVKFFRQESFMVTSKAGGKCVWLNVDGDRTLLEDPKFSEDASEVVYAIGTVTYTMLQLAVYMGMREIYIIGCDNSYGLERKKDGTIVNNGTASYFAGSDSKSDKNVGSTWEMNIAYEYARIYADEHGINIYNATRGGHLEAFERVSFDCLF